MIRVGPFELAKRIDEIHKYYSARAVQSRVNPHQLAFIREAHKAIRPTVPVRKGRKPYPASYQPFKTYGRFIADFRKPGDLRRSVKGVRAKRLAALSRGRIRNIYLWIDKHSRGFLSGARQYKGKYSHLLLANLNDRITPAYNRYTDKFNQEL